MTNIDFDWVQACSGHTNFTPTILGGGGGGGEGGHPLFIAYFYTPNV